MGEHKVRPYALRIQRKGRRKQPLIGEVGLHERVEVFQGAEKLNPQDTTVTPQVGDSAACFDMFRAIVQMN